MSDPEPRRSVRSTKGQHKALEQQDQPVETKKRGRKTGRRAEEKQDDTEEEIIRCVCGATEQDGDPGEPWIACDRCTAWQHNVCMGMSVYSEDLAKDYFCEQCKPENHKELLEGIARGERPWEERRRIYEEEKANEKKKKGGRKAKPKRNSDVKEGSAKPSPAPESKKETKATAGAKRKSRGGSEDHDGKVTQKRKISEKEAVPVYNPPDDLPERITELPDGRQPPAKGMYRAINDALGTLQKKGAFIPAENATIESTAERFAIQIERAVHDEHPHHKEYGAQVRTLRFNLKENHDLCSRLLRGTLTPPMLAAMTSDELASKELQQKTAKMKAQAERQSILETEDAAPRLRRTHKGEELVEKDKAPEVSEDKPSVLRRQSTRETGDAKAQVPDRPKTSDSNTASRLATAKGNLSLDTQSVSPKSDFDIKKVFSSVKSPTAAHQRRPSQPQAPATGPGVDAEVDRLLQDDGNESPPYSPTEESDPDIVWRGTVGLNSVANFQAIARHVGGANLSTTIGLPWDKLVPHKLTVAGRIDEQIATEYLCSLRYSPPTDITVASLSPASDAAKADFLATFDYFMQRKRYGVVGEKGVGNVRDTYLVPLPAGTGNHPEFMLNLEDNFIPVQRAAPMLLLVVVYRNDAVAMEKLRGPNWASPYSSQASSAAAAATPTPSGQRTLSIGAPPSAISPTFQAVTSTQPPASAQNHSPANVVPHIVHSNSTASDGSQQEGEAVAREMLGPWATCPTAVFLIAQAAGMHRREWHFVREVYEKHPQSQHDLQLLKRELEKYPKQHAATAAAATSAKTPQTPVPVPRVPHTIIPHPSQPTPSGSPS